VRPAGGFVGEEALELQAQVFDFLVVEAEPDGVGRRPGSPGSRRLAGQMQTEGPPDQPERDQRPEDR
jgi:hypothetical protein